MTAPQGTGRPSSSLNTPAGICVVPWFSQKCLLPGVEMVCHQLTLISTGAKGWALLDIHPEGWGKDKDSRIPLHFCKKDDQPTNMSTEKMTTTRGMKVRPQQHCTSRLRGWMVSIAVTSVTVCEEARILVQWTWEMKFCAAAMDDSGYSSKGQ